jgi:hypothetical protein
LSLTGQRVEITHFAHPIKKLLAIQIVSSQVSSKFLSSALPDEQAFKNISGFQFITLLISEAVIIESFNISQLWSGFCLSK